MDYLIRKARMEDAPALNELLTLLIKDEKKYDDNVNENCTINNFYENIINSDKKIVLVATCQSEIVGYLFGYIIDDGNTYLVKKAKLDALYVISKHRSQGIGANLIKEFKNWCLNNSVKTIEVTVLKNNKTAENLYIQNGFQDYKKSLIAVIDEEN